VNKTIAEVHSALRAAIADKRLEADRAIEFYFDSEVVIRSVLGFRQLTDSQKRSRDLSEDTMVLRALLSSGYLGRVHLLSSHLIELDYFIRAKDDLLPDSRQGGFRDEVARFLEQYHVGDEFAQLLAAVESSNGTGNVGGVIDAIKAFDVSSFVAVELANGAILQRFSSMHKAGVLGFEQHEVSFEAALQDGPIEAYLDIITRAMPEAERERRKDGTFRDALALVQLQRKVRASSGKRSTKPLVRFYAEAELLKKVFKDKAILRDLAYEDSHLGGGILRPPYYFLLRTYFQSLALPHLKSVFRGSISITLEELEECCVELEKLPAERKIEKWDVASLRNRKLAKELRALESLAFFQGIWPSYKLPDGMSHFFDRLQAMAELFHKGAFSKTMQARIFDEMAELRAKLAASTQDLIELLDLLAIVERGVDKLRVNRPDDRLPNLMRDVGLVRWGFAVPMAVEKAFEARLRTLLGGRDTVWKEGCRTLVDDIKRDAANADRAAVICGSLWFLEIYDRLGSFIDSLKSGLAERTEELPLEFHLMRAAARLRSDAALTRNEKVELIGALRELIFRLPEEEQIRYKIGFAYLLAHAANFEEKLFKAAALDAVERGWVKESFSFACEVKKKAGPESLLRAYAVNHCAYVGTVVGDNTLTNQEETLECMRDLLAMQASRSSFWNFRFVDTVLMPSFHSTRMMLDDIKEGRIPKHFRHAALLKLQKKVDAAFDAYASLAAYLDTETMSHRAQWEAIEKDLMDVWRSLSSGVLDRS
jgi:hypothetical protein